MLNHRTCSAIACFCLLSAAAAHAVTVTNIYSGTQTVSANLSDPGGGDLRAVQVVSGVVTFTGSNTYSGGTEILGGSTNVASSVTATTTTPLGGGPVTIRGNGALTIDNTRLGGLTLTNDLYLNDVSLVQTTGDTAGKVQVAFSNNVVNLGGTANISITGSTAGGNVRDFLGFFGLVQNEGASTGRLVVTGGAFTGYDGDGGFRLGASNTFSGGVIATNFARVDVRNNNALGIGPVVVNNNSMLRLVSTTVTNNITFQGGSLLRGQNGGEGLNGVITLNGAVSMYSGAGGAYLITYLNQGGGKITGPGGPNFFLGYWNQDNYDKFYLYGDNDFTGATVVSNSAQVTAYHANAFGTNASTIFVQGSGKGGSYLIPASTLPTGLHTNKSFWLGTYGTYFHLTGMVSNTTTLAGGAIAFEGGGATTRTNCGAILVLSNTTSTISVGGFNAAGHWYQTGSMSGGGALVLTGYREDTKIHFSGSNAGYSGTIYNMIKNYPDRRYVGSDNGLGTGTYFMLGDTVTRTMLQLDTSVTLTNAFAGTGTVNTATYTLTHTGTLVPSTTNRVGTIAFASSGAGKYDFRGTYNWNYNATTNDLVTATTLAFGNPGGAATLNVVWAGGGSEPSPAPTGSYYTIFTYTSTSHPVITTPWKVTSARNFVGSVTVDTANKRVLLKLTVPGTMILFR